MGALVKADHNICSERKLQLDGFFRCELDLAPAALRIENKPILVHFPERFVLTDQRKSLKAAGISDDGTVPAAHAVHTAK